MNPDLAVILWVLYGTFLTLTGIGTLTVLFAYRVNFEGTSSMGD